MTLAGLDCLGKPRQRPFYYVESPNPRLLCCDPCGARTRDPVVALSVRIKSHMLYQLS